jgi:hypothetical protein
MLLKVFRHIFAPQQYNIDRLIFTLPSGATGKKNNWLFEWAKVIVLVTDAEKNLWKDGRHVCFPPYVNDKGHLVESVADLKV